MARDKLSCLQILENHQIPVPKTIYISNSLSIEYLLRQMEEFPTVIKLVSGTQGLGVILAENYKNAESIIEAFYATREKVILQKFIKKPKAEIKSICSGWKDRSFHETPSKKKGNLGLTYIEAHQQIQFY